jgi:hypothetical protein
MKDSQNKTSTSTGNKLENLYKKFDAMSGMALETKSLKAYRSTSKAAEQLEKLAIENANTTHLRLCGPLDVYLQQLDLPSQQYIHAKSRYIRLAFRKEANACPYINVSIRLSTGQYNERSGKLLETKYISGDYFLNGDETHASFDQLENDLTAFGLVEDFHKILDRVEKRAQTATSRNNLHKLVCDNSY